MLLPLSSRRAITLVELLVVVAIIGILIAVTAPAVQAAREAARRVECVNTLKQIGIAAVLHFDTHRAFPTAGWGWTIPREVRLDQAGRYQSPSLLGDQSWGWRYQLLPFMEYQDLWMQELDANIRTARPPLINCPSRRPPTFYTGDHGGIESTLLGDYVGNGGDTGENGNRILGLTPNPLCRCRFQKGTIVWYEPKQRDTPFVPLRNPFIQIHRITDGSSHTMLFGEKYVSGLWTEGGSWGDNAGWYVGRSWDTQRFAMCSPQSDTYLTHLPANRVKGNQQYDFFGAAHPTGFNVCMADGSATSITYAIDFVTLQRLCNRQDGQLSDVRF